VEEKGSNLSEWMAMPEGEFNSQIEDSSDFSILRQGNEPKNKLMNQL